MDSSFFIMETVTIFKMLPPRSCVSLIRSSGRIISITEEAVRDAARSKPGRPELLFRQAAVGSRPAGKSSQ